jgi:hypothetical protein
MFYRHMFLRLQRVPEKEERRGSLSYDFAQMDRDADGVENCMMLCSSLRFIVIGVFEFRKFTM